MKEKVLFFIFNVENKIKKGLKVLIMIIYFVIINSFLIILVFLLMNFWISFEFEILIKVYFVWCVIVRVRRVFLVFGGL